MNEPYKVWCARCGKRGSTDEFVIEEGDEWECPSCNERENQREQGLKPVPKDDSK